MVAMEGHRLAYGQMSLFPFLAKGHALGHQGLEGHGVALSAGALVGQLYHLFQGTVVVGLEDIADQQRAGSQALYHSPCFFSDCLPQRRQGRREHIELHQNSHLGEGFSQPGYWLQC